MKDVTLPSPSWLQEEGPEGDVVLATRAILRRNLSSVPFLPNMSEEHLLEVQTKVEEALEAAGLMDSFGAYRIMELPEMDIRYLEEEGTLPEDSPRAHRVLYIQPGGKLMVAVNTQDHLRMEARLGGLRVQEGFRDILGLDKTLERYLDYAFSLEWGYLTTRLEESGSGLSFSFVLHLPGIAMRKEVETIRLRMESEECWVRPLFLSAVADNEIVPLGDLFLLEPRQVVGKTEEEVCKRLEERVQSLLDYERKTRVRLWKERGVALEDKVNRSLGVLERAKTLQLEETLEMLSLVRWGACMGVLPANCKGLAATLMIESCPAHVSQRVPHGKRGDDQSEALERARHINESFQKVKGRGRV